jgi:hypothetical protein
MALITTPGSATANSFASLVEFDAYHESRVPVLTWLAAATDDQKEAALKSAARALNAYFVWTGSAVDAVQALTWPRSGMLSRNGFAIPTSGASSIPGDLKNAQCELAGQLGASDLTGSGGGGPLDQGITSIKAGDVAVTFSDVLGQQQGTVEASDVAIRRSALFYLDAPDEVRRLLVPSWFLQKSVARPFLLIANGGA